MKNDPFLENSIFQNARASIRGYMKLSDQTRGIQEMVSDAFVCVLCYAMRKQKFFGYMR